MPIAVWLVAVIQHRTGTLSTFSPIPLISCANLRFGGVLIGAERDPAVTVHSIWKSIS
jgi:hypothetical protein